MTPERQLGIELVLGALEAQLVETRRFGRAVRLVGNLDQRRSTPQRQSPPGQGTASSALPSVRA